MEYVSFAQINTFLAIFDNKLFFKFIEFYVKTIHPKKMTVQ
jgi:hypothetical protein